VQESGHSHDGGHDHAHDAPRKALWIAIILNAAFLIIEAAVGWWANSLALLSDAGHMVSDVASLGIALGGIRLAELDSSDSYTFGLQRVPVVGALINGATLLVIVVLITREAIGRLIHPTEVQGGAVLVVGIAGLIVNVVSAWYLHRQGGDSVNVRGAFLHLVADALGSVAAIGSAVVILWTGWTPIDPILSFLIGALIVYSTWPLLRETIDIILQRAPGEIEIEKLKSTLLRPEVATELLDLHVWQLDSSHLVLSAIVGTSRTLSVAECNRLADEVRSELDKEFGIVHATLEWRDPEHPTDGCHAEYDISLYPEDGTET